MNNVQVLKSDSGDELKALAEKYQMSNTEYVFLKKFFKPDPSHWKSFLKHLIKKGAKL